HACEDGAVVVLRGPADLAQAERAERAAVLLGLADLATYLGDPDLGHLRPFRTLWLRATNFCVHFRRLARRNVSLWLRATNSRATNSLVALSRRFVGKDLGHGQAPHLRHLVGAAQALEAVDG